MSPDKCALVITSSVYVSAPLTALVDPGLREAQYLGALDFFIRESPITRIIVCDNSGYSYPETLVKLAASFNKKLELLSFTGNSDLVAEYGKGYGEGETLKFIFSKSLLMAEVDGILKMTGRLRLVNSGDLLRHTDPATNYFMPVSLLRPRFLVPRAARPCLDVRVYYATKFFFRDVLLDAYLEVRDRELHFLEHAYYHAISVSGIKVKCFPVAPEITGVSGSNGWVFREPGPLKKILAPSCHQIRICQADLNYSFSIMDIRTGIYSKIRRKAGYVFHDLRGRLGLNEKLFREARGSRIVVYHGICRADPTRFNSLFVTSKTFEEHLQFYRRYFNIVSLDAYYGQEFSKDRT